jgi:hypothetical protein
MHSSTLTEEAQKNSDDEQASCRGLAQRFPKHSTTFDGSSQTMRVKYVEAKSGNAAAKFFLVSERARFFLQIGAHSPRGGFEEK